MRAIYLCNNPKRWASVYAPEIRARLAALYDIADVCFTAADLEGHDFSDVALIFSTWGMPPLTEAQIARHLPGLRSVFYAAGTVQAFARPFFDRGVQVFSAWQANAVPVAEYTTAQFCWPTRAFSRCPGKLPAPLRLRRCQAILQSLSRQLPRPGWHHWRRCSGVAGYRRPAAVRTGHRCLFHHHDPGPCRRAGRPSGYACARCSPNATSSPTTLPTTRRRWGC